MKNSIYFVLVSFVISLLGCAVHEDTNIVRSPYGDIVDQRVSGPLGSKHVRTQDSQSKFDECRDRINAENGETRTDWHCLATRGGGMGMGMGMGMGITNPNMPMNDPGQTPGMQAASGSFATGLAPIGNGVAQQGTAQSEPSPAERARNAILIQQQKDQKKMQAEIEALKAEKDRSNKK